MNGLHLRCRRGCRNRRAELHGKMFRQRRRRQARRPPLARGPCGRSPRRRATRCAAGDPDGYGTESVSRPPCPSLSAQDRFNYPSLPSAGAAPGAHGDHRRVAAATACEGCTEMFRRFSAAVATSREGYRSPRSDRAVQHRRWGRELERERHHQAR
jgi:hypothetical protein